MEKSPSTQPTAEIPQWDFWGLLLSGLCIVHCLLTPVFLVVLPNLVPQWVQAEGHGHAWFFFLLVIIASFSVFAGFRRHNKWAPIAWLFAGLTVVGVATFGLDGNWEYGLTIMGSLLLLRGHYLNRKQCRLCKTLDKKPVCCH
ncbi:MAG: MerC domain-containing protein [Bdellovibrionaceae bacterium]|nr:MerC domain-containing protein [Bdellovibrionales bacterium]MCB9084986.1 MerC domain-containing protein [Pseudobdellovibrionaceae bacterium]